MSKKMSQIFKDQYGLSIYITADENSYDILWSNGTQDIYGNPNTTEYNFMTAVNKVRSMGFVLSPQGVPRVEES